MLVARTLKIGERVYILSYYGGYAIGKIVSIDDKTEDTHFSGDEQNINVAVRLEDDFEDFGAKGEICNADNQDVYQIVPRIVDSRTRNAVCYEHYTDIDYPYFSPYLNENLYEFETEDILEDTIKSL